MSKKRLDVLLIERGLFASREKAQASILAGEVFDSKGNRLEKAGNLLSEEILIEIKPRRADFKSRAGHKLQHAINAFKISVSNRVCMDIGASTGGFTHCLLKEGAQHVVAVDVGYGQLDTELRNHSQVTNLEKTNARHLKAADIPHWGNQIELIVVDVSFISLSKVIEPLMEGFPTIKDWVLLFKPQFEVGPENLGKKGRVRSIEATQEAIEKFDIWMKAKGFDRQGEPEPSPLPGKKSGNLEYLVFYARK